MLPTRNAVAASRRTSVAVTLNKPLSASVDLQQSLRVFSQQTGGRKAGTATVNGSTLTFDPTTDFAAGETVFATVTPVVQSSTGQALVRPQVFQFTTATVPSAGSFLTDSDVPVGSQPFRVATGDIDGDGDLDMLVAKRSGTTVSVRRNDGSGNFGGTQEIAVAGLPISLAVGDLDGDGDLDLITGNTGNTVSVRLNDGSGTFAALKTLPPEAPTPPASCWATSTATATWIC